MNRKQTIATVGRCLLLAGVIVAYIGCKGFQVGHILKPNTGDMVGSHAAGAGTFNPLVDQSVQKLLGAAEANETSQLQGQQMPPSVNICFVGIENRSSEELGDFKEQLVAKIESMINSHPMFNSISRHYVDTGLRLTRLRPDELFVPNNMRIFSAAMEQTGQPFEYMLYAKLTSGTTQNNNSQQKDYLLSLSLTEVSSGRQILETAEVRKGYHKNAMAKVLNYNPFKPKK